MPTKKQRIEFLEREVLGLRQDVVAIAKMVVTLSVGHSAMINVTKTLVNTLATIGNVNIPKETIQ